MVTPATAFLPEQRAPRSSADNELLMEIRALNRKIDVLGDQVNHLYQRTVALEELKDELVPIARDMMNALTAELQSSEHEFNAEELAQLARKVIHNTPVFIRMLDRLESVDGLVSELEPLSKEVVREWVDRLQEFEDRGYFRMMRGMLTLFDRVASHATQEDIDRLNDNLTRIIDTVKTATQPDMLATVNNALAAVHHNHPHAPKRVTLWGLMRAWRDPQIQEGMAVMLEVMRQVGTPPQLPAKSESTEDSE